MDATDLNFVNLSDEECVEVTMGTESDLSVFRF